MELLKRWGVDITEEHKYVDILTDIYVCSSIHVNIKCKACGMVFDRGITSFYNATLQHVIANHRKHNEDIRIIKDSLILLCYFPTNRGKDYEIFLVGDVTSASDYLVSQPHASKKTKTINEAKKIVDDVWEFYRIYDSCLLTCIFCGNQYDSTPSKEIVISHVSRCEQTC